MVGFGDTCNCGVVGTGAAGFGTAFTAGPGVAVVRNGSTGTRLLPPPCWTKTPVLPPAFSGTPPKPNPPPPRAPCCCINTVFPGNTGIFMVVGSNAGRMADVAGDVTTPRAAGSVEPAPPNDRV